MFRSVNLPLTNLLIYTFPNTTLSLSELDLFYSVGTIEAPRSVVHKQDLTEGS